jgi:hypothetical protein
VNLPELIDHLKEHGRGLQGTVGATPFMPAHLDNGLAPVPRHNEIAQSPCQKDLRPVADSVDPFLTAG